MQKQVETKLPTDWGNFTLIAYSENENEAMPHLILISEHTDFTQPINIRIHSECMTGDVFHSKKCECGKQLDFAMNYFKKNGGILFYLRQEGRGIGLINKLKAYNLQEQGYDTAQANIELGFPADARDFSCLEFILNDLKIKEVNLLTNNPDKLNFIKNSSIKLIQRIPIEIEKTQETDQYLQTKKLKFGHFLQ